MTPEEIISRLLGSEQDLTHVEMAFSGHNKRYREYSWNAQAEVRGERIFVKGVVYNDTTPIGEFERSLFYAHGKRRAHHKIFVLGDGHEGKKTGYFHTQRVIDFYDSNQYETVTLDADGYGPFVWPQFGWDLRIAEHKERLHKILRLGGWPDELPTDPRDLFAPDLALTIAGERNPIGLLALKQLHQNVDGLLPMVLDLSDQRRRRLLAKRGILATQGI